MDGSFVFKIAEGEEELSKIHKMNYNTFVEEIPQHNSNDSKILIDKFNEENTYFIALREDELVGMLCIRDRRPFSLDMKIADLDSYLPKANSICEVRLLSVQKQYRNGVVLLGLLKEVLNYMNENEYDMLIISGILKQEKLYRHLGFIPFGPTVGSGEAIFQPMYITWDTCKVSNILDIKRKSTSFLPGPVEISEKVKYEFSKEPISHRSDNFKKVFHNTKRLLCELVKAKHVEVFMGSGTLANDYLTANMCSIEGSGLVISNGEFGERLISHVNRFNLSFVEYKVPWGQDFDIEHIESILKRKSDIKWLYMVHCETSTGMLNDIVTIQNLCEKYGVLLCLDCISSVGNVEVDLSKIYMATATSGKGIASFCGLGMIFYNHELKQANDNVPRYFDLYKYKMEGGIPYTISSNLVNALNVALKELDLKHKQQNINCLNKFLSSEFKRIGMKILNCGENASPAVINIKVPNKLSSKMLGDYLKRNGFCLSYESGYLLCNNWIQICLMGNLKKDDGIRLVKLLENRNLK